MSAHRTCPTGARDGGHPAFRLTDRTGQACAFYTDFMGTDDTGTWLAPPGVTRN